MRHVLSMQSPRTAIVRPRLPLVALLLALFLPKPTFAHLDPPGPPQLTITNEIMAISVSTNIDDGTNAVAEVFVLVETDQQQAHPMTLTGGGIYNPIWNTSAELTWDVFPDYLTYTHDECTPMTPLHVTYKLWEDDSYVWAKAVNGYFAVVTLAGLYTLNPVVVGSTVACQTIFYIATIWGDQFLGTVSSTPTGPGAWTDPSVDGKIVSYVTYRVKSTARGPGGCTAGGAGQPDPAPESNRSPGDRDLLISKYHELLELIVDSDSLEPEDGNPANLTTEENQENRETLKSMLWAMSDTVTTYQAAAIVDYPGPYEQALTYIDEARLLRDSQPLLAMGNYIEAALIVYDTLIDSPTSDVSGGRELSAELRVVPNPTTAGVDIWYSADASGPVSIAIFDAEGRKVRLLEDVLANGLGFSAHWDGRDEVGRRLPNGTYWARVASANGDRSARITVTRP